MDVFKPFELIADYVISILKLSPTTQAGESVHFFIYDTLKIFVLILIISFVVGIVKSYFTPETTKKYLTGKRQGVGNILAACLGIVTPFCSCSAIPLFLGFLESGVPLGVTFSFLISAPMNNEVAIIMLWSLFGYKVALIYILSGLIIAVLAGIIISKMHMEKYIERFVFEMQPESCCCCKNNKTKFTDRMRDAKRSAYNIFHNVWLYIVIGVAIGAVIHGYVPAEFMLKYAGSSNAFAVPIAVILGVPLYANVAGVLPIAEVFVKQGLPMGTVLAFTMSVTAISLPELIILRKIMKPRLLLTFVTIITIAIIFTGYLFNYLLS